MLKQKRGSINSFLTIILVIAVILISIYLYWYLNTDQTQVPIFEGNLQQDNTEGQISGQGNSNILNPLNVMEPGKNKENSTQKYHYQQIDQNAKLIYQALEKNIENLKTGTYTIDLGDQFQDLLSTDNGKERLNQAYQIALDAFSMDHPEVFYLDITKMIMTIHTKTIAFYTSYKVKIGNDTNANYLIDGFSNKQQVEEAISQIEEVKNAILIQAKGNEYHKIKYAHDWIVENVSYDETTTRLNSRNIYGTFIEKKVVCEGYAKAFQVLLNDMGIPSVIVVGTGTNSEGRTESHAWNYVQLNGNWYGVDTTWDDPIMIGGNLTQKLKYKYFLKGALSFYKAHHETGRVSDQGIAFTYPELSSQDYE